MPQALVDLADWRYWLVTCLAAIVLSLAARATTRKWFLAGFNLGFVGMLAGWRSGSLVCLCMLVVYFALVLIGRGRHPRVWLALASSALLLAFVFHKSPGLAIEAAPTLDLSLHRVSEILSIVGFSYVTLRAVDVMRSVYEKRHPPPDLPSTVNYLLPFHMLAAGPIQAYEDFTQPASGRDVSFFDYFVAVERVAWGLFKKFVLAFAVYELFLNDFESNGVYFWIEVQFFFLWLYLDFSAYSDIAVGVGQLIGVRTPENFDRPYLARNLVNFWERWHISLSLFIRRNIFYPIMLTAMRDTDGRRPLFSATLAYTVAFVLCGLWHALTINFLLWGCIHAVGLCTVTLYSHFLTRTLGSSGVKAYLANPLVRIVGIIVTYEFVALSMLALFYPK